MLAYGRLLRLSLAPSALADIAAGTVLGAGLWPRGVGPFLLMAASLCVYHGGMALNDWADRDEDARSGRPRPIPRGAITPRAALACAVGLLLLGPLLASAAEPRAAVILAVVAGLAALYDLRGRGPWQGPLLLGACRAGNLLAGIVFGLTVGGRNSLFLIDVSRADLPSLDAPLLLLYGGYVFCVSRLARLEDCAPDELARAHPGRWLALAARGLLAIGLLPLLLHTPLLARDPSLAYSGVILVPLVLGLAGGWRLAARSRQPAPWTHADVSRSAGMALRRLLVATSAIAAGSGTLDGMIVSAAILLGYPLSYALRKAFPPT